MTSKIFGSIVALVLACSTAMAADIRRVVTALDASDKAIALEHARTSATIEPKILLVIASSFAPASPR